MINFLQSRLRSSPLFRLLPFDGLTASERAAFRSLSEDPEFFGVLLPSEGSVLPAKSVSHDAALLFLALREPACVPHLLHTLFGIQVGERLRQLVLDSVFEVEIAGRFVTGAAALAQLGDRDIAGGTSRIHRLGEEAIEYALALESLPTDDVASRLYLYNTAPSTAALQRRFASDDRLCAFAFESDDVARRLRSTWRSEVIGDSWIAWSRGAAGWTPSYKLYLSPMLEHLPRVFAVALNAFASARCSHFKLGRGAYGLLRPDKLVAYFPNLDELQQVADFIQAAGLDVCAQGVPFTASIDPHGLLSWGMDPPRFQQVPEWQQYQSWRQWLTGRIAVYAVAARQSRVPVHAFVRNRIELDGVDPGTWNPRLAIWRGPAGTEQEVT
jgi:hypothetical protein